MANQSAPEEDWSCSDLIMFALLFYCLCGSLSRETQREGPLFTLSELLPLFVFKGKFFNVFLLNILQVSTSKQPLSFFSVAFHV